MVREFATSQKTHEKLLRSPNPAQDDAPLLIVRPPTPLRSRLWRRWRLWSPLADDRQHRRRHGGHPTR